MPTTTPSTGGPGGTRLPVGRPRSGTPRSSSSNSIFPAPDRTCVPFGGVCHVQLMLQRVGRGRLRGGQGGQGVGQAMACCPDDVPWWRVVHADGSMKGTPGADEQRARLA
ncbi:MAG: MGMT family protein, partial [Actinomycetes bacterium]